MTLCNLFSGFGETCRTSRRRWRHCESRARVDSAGSRCSRCSKSRCGRAARATRQQVIAKANKFAFEMCTSSWTTAELSRKEQQCVRNAVQAYFEARCVIATARRPQRGVALVQPGAVSARRVRAPECSSCAAAMNLRMRWCGGRSWGGVGLPVHDFIEATLPTTTLRASYTLPQVRIAPQALIARLGRRRPLRRRGGA